MCASYYTIWILLLDWLARGMYTITLVLCAEVEVGKSAIYALLSQCRKCRDLRVLGAKKKMNLGLRAKNTEFPALIAALTLKAFLLAHNYHK